MGEESERIRDKAVVESNSLAVGSGAGSAIPANSERNRDARFKSTLQSMLKSAAFHAIRNARYPLFCVTYEKF